MRNNRGKREVEEYYNYNNNNGGYGEGYVEFPCKKHPSSSSTTRGGICAFCLTDRLYQLVCPQCGEQRSGISSSCSCTTTTTTATTDPELFSLNNPNSASSADVGNVGRISFLLENDNGINNYTSEYMSGKPKIEPRLSSSNVDDFNTLRRSNSTCVGVDRKESKDNKFWKIGRLFRKKKEKNYNNNNNNNYEENINNNNNNFDCNNNGVTRSRSISNFRGFYDNEEIGNFPVSTSSAARASSVSTGNFYPDSAKMSCFSESEARFSNFDYLDVNGVNKNNSNYNSNSNNNSNNNIYSVKESEFTSCDDPAYIDLKLDGLMTSSSDLHHSNSKRVPDLATMRRSRLGMSTKEYGYRGGNHEHDMFVRSGSCRRSSVTERELRNCRKSSKVWKWFFKHQSSSSTNRDDPHHEFNNSFEQSS